MSKFQNQLFFKKPNELKSRVSIIKQNELIFAPRNIEVAEFFKLSGLKDLVTRVSILKQSEKMLSSKDMDVAEYFRQRKRTKF